MKPHRLFCLMALSTLLWVEPASAVDWWKQNAASMPVRPDAGSVALQNPPVFSWPLRFGADKYELQLIGPSSTGTFSTKSNWFSVHTTLPVGTYRWRVRAHTLSSGQLTNWSDERSFQVTSASQAFVVPDSDVLWTKASQIAHPRALPKGAELAALKAEFAGTRAADFAKLKANMSKVLGAALFSEPAVLSKSLSAASRSKAVVDVSNVLNNERETVLGLGLLWQVEKNKTWLTEAKRRVLNLANFDTHGSTSVEDNNQAVRTILLISALGYDWFYDEWTSSERALLQKVIRDRYLELDAKIVANDVLLNTPYSSWSSYTLGFLVAVAPLVAGDMPESKAWFKSSFGLYAAIFPPWSGDDGGYSNGTAYGVWDVPESIILWDTLRWATDFDLYRKPSIRNFGAFLAYFQPSGSPEGVFGDGAEFRMAPSVARYAKAFAGRARSPLTDWSSHQMFGEDRSTFAMLTTPPMPNGTPVLPANTQHSIHFPSVGWAALHGDLSDRSAFSVYFKSSPYGSLNHSHADQNSFVIHAKGKVLAMDSGYYDYFNSPHWRDWYKQTRAHNAITFDGGQGQGLGADGTGDKAASGKITKFFSSGEYDIAVGDATIAYQGQLSSAKRWLVLVRPDTLVVVDRLTSVKPRTWEWNFHTSTKPLLENGGYAFGDSVAAACLRVSSPAKLAYKVSEGYSPPPVTSAVVGSHFWSQFAYSAPSTEGVFVSVISDSCSDASLTPIWSNGKAEVVVGGKRISFTGSDVLVQ